MNAPQPDLETLADAQPAQPATMTRPPRWLAPAVIALAAAAAVWAARPFTIVEPGHRGVLVTLGKPAERALPEGIVFHWPFVQRVAQIDVRISRAEGTGVAASKDLQAVTLKVAANVRIDPDAAAKVYRDIAPTAAEAIERIVVPARPEAFKAVAARFTAEELVTRRTEVRDQIASMLQDKIRRHGFILDEFSIVNFEFSPAFAAAIEAKVKAEQEKLKADRDLQRIRVEAEQRVTSARAEADSLRLQREQVTPMLLELRRIESTRAAIAKWDGKLPGAVMGSGGTLAPLLQMQGGATP